MIRFIQLILVALIVSAVAAPANLNAEEQAIKIAAKKYNADVILLRGFANVFSRGLDDMTAKLNKRGVPAKVAHHREWSRFVSEIVANRKKFGRRPIVLIGHSLGANAILKMAEALRKKRITVSYMVTFAATDPTPVPSNVRKLTNYYFKTDGWGEPIKKGAGFRGNLKNIDFSKSKTVGHFNIDKQPRLQKQVIRNVLRFVGRKKRAETQSQDVKSSG